MVQVLRVQALGMSMPLRPLPDDLTFAVFSTAEAHRAGITRARLRGPDLQPVMRGLWMRSDRVLTEREIVAALRRRDPEVFAMGLSAARLLGFPLPGVFDRQIVAAPRQSSGGDRRPRSAETSVDRRIHLGTTGTRRQDTELLRWSLVEAELLTLEDAPSVRTTSRIRTFLDLAGMLERDALVAIGDHLVRMPREEFEDRAASYAEIDELRTAAAEHRGRGARRLREAVELVRMSSDSPMETTMRLAMVRAGLPEPQANAPAKERLANGAVLDLGQPDLQWPQWRVALEYEGTSHRDPDQVPRDIARGERRRGAGWVEVRATSRDLPYDCRSAVARVRQELEQRGWRPR